MCLVWFLVGIWLGAEIECNLHRKKRIKELEDINEQKTEVS